MMVKKPHNSHPLGIIQSILNSVLSEVWNNLLPHPGHEHDFAYCDQGDCAGVHNNNLRITPALSAFLLVRTNTRFN